MIARIRAKGGCYDSSVFAIYDHKNYAEALVFDQDGRELKRVPFTSIIGHSIRIDVFIFDTRTENWVKRGKNEGYVWLLGHEEDDDALERCKEIQANIRVPEWFEIRDRNDVEALISATTGLHDAYVKKSTKREKSSIFASPRGAAKCCLSLREAPRPISVRDTDTCRSEMNTHSLMRPPYSSRTGKSVGRIMRMYTALPIETNTAVLTFSPKRSAGNSP